MNKRMNEVTLLGFGLLIVYGIGLLFYLGTLFLSWVEPVSITQSYFFSSRFKSLPEFQRHTLVLFALYLPQVIGYYGIIQLKDWGRKLIIVMNAVVCAYVVSQMVVLHTVGFFSLLNLFISVLIILFFMQPKIKVQFEAEAITGLGNRKRILIVDDDKGLLKMVRASLMYKGYEVYTAATGEKGLQTAKRKRPNLIILDVILPGIKGREVCSLLKEAAETREIPVIFLTAKASPDDVRAEMEVGAISHITKPVNSQQLLVEIRKILGG